MNSQPQSKNYWPELGLWNLYFLIKLGLFAAGYLNLQVIPNLVFAGFLLVPIGYRPLRVARQLIAIPLGVALFYQDTWLPPFSRLLNQPGVLDFSFAYFAEIVERTINWTMLGLIFVAVIVYLYIHVWIRLSFVSITALIWIGLQQHIFLPVLQGEQAVAAEPLATTTVTAPVQARPADLNEFVDDFWQNQQQLHIDLAQGTDADPVDVLFLSICSLSWDDLNNTGLVSHPVFGQFDIVFDQFNTATSYSGPAVRRLMRASCGQPDHDSMHSTTANQCSLMGQLDARGLEIEALFNHTGEFDGFTEMVLAESHKLQMSGLIEEKSIQRTMVAFDGSPVWRDREVLSAWWQERINSGDAGRALLYNSISLHDGNRIALPNGSSRRAEYRELATGLLDDIAGVVQLMERGERPLIVVLIPEHGASLEGDRMQIAGMGEIPSPSITHVPVAVKLIGFERADAGEQVRIAEQTSYFGLAELIKRLLDHGVTDPLDLPQMASGLPQTEWVSENEQTVVVRIDGQTHVRLRQDGQWLPYPEK